MDDKKESQFYIVNETRPDLKPNVSKIPAIQRFEKGEEIFQNQDNKKCFWVAPDTSLAA